MASISSHSQNYTAPFSLRNANNRAPVLRKSAPMSALQNKRKERPSLAELQESNERFLFIAPKVQAKIYALLTSKAFATYKEKHPNPPRAIQRVLQFFEGIIASEQDTSETDLQYFNRQSFAKAAVNYLSNGGKPEDIKEINRLYKQFKILANDPKAAKEKKDILDDISAYIKGTKNIGSSETLRDGWLNAT